MAVYLVEMFGVSLALTMGIELAVACYLLRGGERGGRAGGLGRVACFQLRRGKWERGRRWGVIVVLVNVLTNPPAVLFCWLGRIWLPAAEVPVQLAAEALVVAVEAYVYRCFAGKPGWGIERPYLLAAAANVCSWLGGRWLMGICGRGF